MLKLRHILFLSSAALGIGAVVALTSGLGQLALKLHTSSTLLIGVIIGLAWFSGVILPPIIGTLSDNTRTRYGRRIPYLAIFIPLTGVMLLFMSFFVATNTVEVSSAGSNADYFAKVTSTAPNEEGGYTLNLSLGSHEDRNIKQMQISLNQSFKGAEWEPYSSTETLSVSSYEQGQTVYAKFRIYTGFAPGWAMPLLIVGIILASAFYNIWNAPYWALMPDITIPDERGKVGGAMQAFNIVGTILAMGISGALWDVNPAYAFYVLTSLVLVSGGITVFGMNERKLIEKKGVAVEKVGKITFREAIKDFFGAKEFAKFVLVGSFWWFSMGTFSTFFVLYVTNYLKVAEGTSLILMGIFTIFLVIAAALLGIYADKIGNKKIVLSIGLLVGVCSMPIAWFITQTVYVFPIMIFVGITFGAVTVFNYAIQADLVPMGKEGELLGIGIIFFALPMMLASFIVGAIVTALANDYRVIWIIGPISLLIALILVQNVDTTPVHK
jgi:Na+/melibiose symporter-like transporter